MRMDLYDNRTTKLVPEIVWSAVHESDYGQDDRLDDNDPDPNSPSGDAKQRKDPISDLKEIVIECQARGVSEEVLEKFIQDLYGKASSQIAKGKQPPGHLRIDSASSNPSRKVDEEGAFHSARRDQAERVQLNAPDTLSRQTVARLLLQFAAQTPERQRTDFHIVTNLLAGSPNSFRQLDGFLATPSQTLNHRAAIYRKLLPSSTHNTSASKNKAAESEQAQELNALTSMVVLWETRPLGGRQAKKLPWCAKQITDFAEHFYPRCSCYANSLPKNVSLIQRMEASRQNSRLLPECPKCRSDNQSYQATPILVRNPPDAQVIGKMLRNLLQNLPFMLAFRQAQEALTETYGFFVFDRITPIIDTNFATAFSPSFTLDGFDRSAQLGFYRGNLEPWRQVLHQNLIERIWAKLDRVEFKNLPPEVDQDKREQNVACGLTDEIIHDPLVSALNTVLDELADEIVKKRKFKFPENPEPEFNKAA